MWISGVRARVRHGHELCVLDMSPAGALVEGAAPLRPGGQLELQIEHNERKGSFRATVVRCDVSAIRAYCGTTYRAGLAFSEPGDWVCEQMTRIGFDVPVVQTGCAATVGHEMPEPRRPGTSGCKEGSK